MKSNLVALQEKKIAKILGRALAIALAAPAAVLGVQACSSDDSPVNDAGPDASTGTDSAVDDGGANDDSGPVEAGVCSPYVIHVDASAPDGGVECGVFQRFPCGAPPALTLYSDCYFKLDDCQKVCPGSLFFNCHYYSPNCDGGIVDDGGNGDAGDTVIECASCPNGVGRRPDGLLPIREASRGPHCTSRVAGYFAAAAHLEAASVHAFRIMKIELGELGAPADILRAAERARRDEIRHTKLTARITKRHGGRPIRAHVGKRAARSLEAIAIENAVEGCVRETFGALVAMWQAARAGDPAIAEAMNEIAVDEARHAALAWSVAAWAESKLDAAANARVQAAKTKALRELDASIAVEPHAELSSVAGLPSAAAQRAMLDALSAELAA
ncbi:MAG: ferritin-like domain-containing protein [Polyangiaceae bacterium]